METQAWIVIVADAGGKGRGRAKTLELMNAKVDFVRSETEAITLLRHWKRAKNLLYILADEIGGLARAIRVHRQSALGKCVILSNSNLNRELDLENAENLLLLKAPEPKCYHWLMAFWEMFSRTFCDT